MTCFSNPLSHRSYTKRVRALRQAIGSNIQHIRRRKYMTLKELSRRTGLSIERLDHFEMGKNKIELHHILIIAEALKIGHERLIITRRQ